VSTEGACEVCGTPGSVRSVEPGELRSSASWVRVACPVCIDRLRSDEVRSDAETSAAPGATVTRIPGANMHVPGCKCTRCVGFQPGNALAVTHGARSSALRLSSETHELVDLIRPHLPIASPGFEATLESYALVLVRVRRAAAAIDDIETALEDAGLSPSGLYLHARSEALDKLRKDMRLWLASALRYADALGLTPSAQARIIRDGGIGKAAASSAALRELRAHVERNFGRGEIVEADAS
jgi:hypothetical protein